MQVIAMEKAAIPARTADVKRESRIRHYHYKLWRMRRNARHDEYDRIHREAYTESMFFGLSLRQFFFSVLACGVAVGIYLGLSPILGTETTSWLCIVAAFPFAVLGFLKYNGMTAEKFVAAWIKSTFMIPKVLLFGNTNYYYSMLADESSETTGKRRFHRRGSRSKRHTVSRQGLNNKRQRKRAK